MAKILIYDKANKNKELEKILSLEHEVYGPGDIPCQGVLDIDILIADLGQVTVEELENIAGSLPQVNIMVLNSRSCDYFKLLKYADAMVMLNQPYDLEEMKATLENFLAA